MNLLLDRLKGNDRLKRRLWTLLQTDSLPHALIIEGGEGSGKTTLAFLLSQALACRESDAPCGVCEICRKIEEDICPDVITVDVAEDKKFITVDQIRALREEAFIRPNDCEVKIFIIRNAPRLNVQTQNMLLKILEEPPKDTYFFLLCESSAALLPTVRSRAPIVKMQHFDEQTLSEFLCDISLNAVLLQKNDPSSFARLLQNAEGSIGKALSLLDNKSGGENGSTQKTDELLGRLCGKRPIDRSDLLLFAQTIGTTREEATAFFDELLKALRDLLAVKKSRRHCRLMYFCDMETAADYAYALSHQSICTLSEETLRVRSLVADTNANINLIKHTFADAVYSAV